MKRSFAYLYVTLAVAAGSAYFFVEPTPMSKLVLYNGVGLLSLVAMVVGLLMNKSSHKAPWVLFALGQASFLTADVTYYLLETHSAKVPFPSVADGFYLLMYPLVIAGLALKIRRRSNGTKDWAGLIDAGIFAIALFSALWVLVMDEYVPIAGQATAERFISLSYPVMDLAVLFMAIRLAVISHKIHRSLALIMAALCSLVIADVQYGVLNAADAFQTGSIVDAFWLGFYVLFALASLNRSTSNDVGAETTGTERLSTGRLVLMFVATLLVPVIDLFWGNSGDRYVTLPSSAVLFALMLGRVIGLVRSVELGRERLHTEARHDPLTGLANRTQFAELTAKAIGSGQSSVAVLLIDLDDFKMVNDSLGHEAGDRVLSTIAERLVHCVRDTDLVARLGGDEFAVLVTKLIDRQDAANTASRIIRALNEPIALVDRHVRVGGSVGVAIQCEDHDDVHSLLRGADVAMYLAKHEGKGRFVFFEQRQYAEIVDRLELKADLELALAANQLEVYFQPIVDTDSAVVRSVEALVRWNHPQRGMIPPAVFIPLAEETGEINAIGQWVLNVTCRQVRAWQLTVPHCGELRASVNLSARQLHDKDLLHIVTDAIRTSGLSPEYLMLEVTESLLVADSASTRTLQQLTALKVRIAVDDFGTGYSSLSYLHSFPVDTIKIDQSFVQKIEDSSTSLALVRTVIDLARAVGGTTVAEGVETLGQLNILSDLKCDLVQGYLYSQPVPAAEFTEFLIRRNEKEQVLPLPVRNAASESETSETSAVSARARRIEIVRGVRNMESFLPELAEFHRTVGAPISARWRWMASWFQLHPDADLQCVLVLSPNGRIDAAAILARQRAAGETRFFALDHQMANVASLFARNEPSAKELARGIADLVRSVDGPWALDVGQVAGASEVAGALALQLPGLTVAGQLPVPQVLLRPGMTVDQLLSRGMRKQLRRAHARLDQQAENWEVRFHRGTGSIMAQLPEIESVHISRDHEQRNGSDLDDALDRRFWQETVVVHTYSDELELATLVIDGSVASYVIAMIDGPAYRVFDGRMNGSFSGYSPGRILEAATLERVVSDKRFTTFDWMTGVAPETILAANFWEPRCSLRTTSSHEPKRPLVQARSASLKTRSVDLVRA